jgi:hypothetical protein
MTVGQATASVPAGASAAGSRPSRLGRFIDRGAIFAGYVGIGMAVVVAIGFELIIAVQTLVFAFAPIGGALIGAYANVRSARWRPMRRVFANAIWAALITGLSLALIYGSLRLLFVFVDTGALPDTTHLPCQVGPDCTYQRYVTPWSFTVGEAGADEAAALAAEAEARRAELAAVGVVDGPSFGAYAVGEVLRSGAVLVVLTLAGALVAAGLRSLRRPSSESGVAVAG